MKYLDRLNQRLDENFGVITVREVRELGIPTVYLSRLVKRGELERFERGYYIRPDSMIDEYAMLQNHSKVIIISGLSALNFHQLTLHFAYKLEVTVYKGYNASRFPNNVEVHYVRKEVHELGLMEGTTNMGNKVRLYDMERTICDLFVNRDQIDDEIFIVALKKYLNRTDKNLLNLKKYSRILGVEKEVNKIVTILFHR